MADKFKVVLTPNNRAFLIGDLREYPDGWILRIDPPKRTLNQNGLIHPVVRQIQVYMEANGAPKRPESWWRYYLLGKYRGQEVVQDPDGSGGIVVINRSTGTSDLDKDEASEFIEWLYSFGTDIGVKFNA